MVRFSKVLLSEPDTVCKGDIGGQSSAYDAVVKQCIPLLCKLLSSTSAQDMTATGTSQVHEYFRSHTLELFFYPLYSEYLRP